MFGTFALSLLLVSGDPRPELVELQLAGRLREALERVDRELAATPEASYRLGLDYLRGRLLQQLKRPRNAAQAFADTIGHTPSLAAHSRYQLALEQERMGHPEVAAGLVATAAATLPSASPLLPSAIRLLGRTINGGGDCRLLQSLAPERFSGPERRRMALASAECALRRGDREFARGLLVNLVEEGREDDPARLAAERLATFVPSQEGGRVSRLLGLTFHQHRDFERALQQLARTLLSPGGTTTEEEFEVLSAQARSHFSQGQYGSAAALFAEISRRAQQKGDLPRLSQALYHQGRAYELLGQWNVATASFRRAYATSPEGLWASPALLAALRLEWRAGQEGAAFDLYTSLMSRWSWRDQAGRAALFLAASDLVRGRRDRAGAWLDQAEGRGGTDTRPEIAYWRGRLAEQNGAVRAAVQAYLAVCQGDLDHPLCQLALRRLASPALARAATAEGRRLAGAQRASELYGAWVLLGEGDVLGRNARKKAVQLLLEDRATAPFLRLTSVPVEQWPLWRNAGAGSSPGRPEEMLLALGLWEEGAPAVRDHFPLSQPSLAFTGAQLLARGGETMASIQLAEQLRQRTPERLPLSLQPQAYQQLLYPAAFQRELASEGQQHKISPHLLAALLREESRFDPWALASGAGRSASRSPLADGRRHAASNRLAIRNFSSEELYQVQVALSLGADRLTDLLRKFGGSPYKAVAAFDTGETEARLWRQFCATDDEAEYYTKVNFPETRAYLRRVLASWSRYQRLYPKM